jgi:rubredoxin
MATKESPTAANVYECDECGYKYASSGHNGLDIDDQEDWECPDCQATRDHFHLVVPPDDDLVEGDEDGEDEDSSTGATLSTGRLIYREKSDPSVSSLKTRRDRGRLNPQPDFQRYQVWTKQKNSRLIESMLLDLPLPLIYFAQLQDSSTVVIDGQQRLMAIFDFLDGKYALSGLGPLKEELEGKKFAELDQELQEHLEDFNLSVVEILKESDDDIKFNLFERLNTGATSLNDQELRNSIYRGAYNEFVKELAALSDFRKVLRLTGPHKRMVDVEFVLRYMAFRDQTYLKHDDKKTGRFLNRQMGNGNRLSEANEKQWNKYRKGAETDFKNAIASAFTVFGDKAFKRYVVGADADHPTGRWEKRNNKALMDVQLWGFTQYSRSTVTANRDLIYEMAVELMGENAEFADLLRHTISEKKRVIRRFRIWEDALAEALKGKDNGPRLFDRKLKEKLFKRDDTCTICEQRVVDIDDAHVDHVRSSIKGGATAEANAALAHRFCNMSKGSSD